MSKALFLIALLLADVARAADLTIVILEGDGAFNNIKRKLGRNIRVEVRDERDQRVPNAEVVFTAPTYGPTVSFNQQAEYRTQTDSQGQAATTGLTPNGLEGRFNIRVAASSPGSTGNVVVGQTNTLAGGIGPPIDPNAKPSPVSKKALWITVLGGAATAGIIFATLGGGNSATVITPGGTGAASLSVGTVTVGGPR